jgi:hypothetical protein
MTSRARGGVRRFEDSALRRYTRDMRSAAEKMLFIPAIACAHVA